VSVVELEVMGHAGVSCSGLQAADLIVVGLEGPHKLVDAGAGGSELLGGDGGASLHCGSKSVGHCAGNFSKFVPTEMNEGFGRARG
jgi:hypothetical protein